MATPITIANIARVSAGLVASAWALMGLGDAWAAGAAHGLDALVIVGVVVNAALLFGAACAFVGVRLWRPVMTIAMVAATADRLVSVLGTGDYLFAATSIALLVAVLGITAVSRSES